MNPVETRDRSIMSIYVLAFLIGVIAGLRSMTAPAVVSWAARLGWLHLENTWLAFLGSAVTPYILKRAGDRGIDHRQAAEDAQPQSARAVRRSHRDGGVVRRRDRRAEPGSDRRPGGGRAGRASRGRWAATSSVPGWSRRSEGRIFRSPCSRTPSRSAARFGSSSIS